MITLAKGIEALDVADRDEVDLSIMRPVASVIMAGGDPGIVVYFNDSTPRRFYVDTPGVSVIVVLSTINQAVKLALRNGGWG